MSTHSFRQRIGEWRKLADEEQVMTDDEARELVLSKARLMGLLVITPSYTGNGAQFVIEAPIGKAFKGRGHWLTLGGLLTHRHGFYVEMLELFDQGFDDAPYDPRMA